MLHSFINVAMELEHPYIHLPLPILEAYVKKMYPAIYPQVCQKHWQLSTILQGYRNLCPFCRRCHKSRTAWSHIYDGRTYFATDCKKDCLRADLISSKMCVMRLGYRFMQSAALILLQAMTAQLPIHHPLMMLCQTLVFRDLLMLWNVEPPEDVLCRGWWGYDLPTF